MSLFSFDIRNDIASVLAAFLCGLLGSLVSILAFIILWLVPTITPQSPPRLAGHLHHYSHRSVAQQPSTSSLLAASFTSIRDTLKQKPRLSSRHVSFYPDVSKSLRANRSLPEFSPPIQRKWSSAVLPFQKRRTTSASDLSLRINVEPQSAVNELGILSSSTPHTPFSRQHKRSASAPLSQIRFSLSRKRKSSPALMPTSVDEHAPSSEPSTSAHRMFQPVGFVNLLNKRSASRTRSPCIVQSPETPPSATCAFTSDGLPLDPHATTSTSRSISVTGRRRLVSKLTSMFRSSADDVPPRAVDPPMVFPSKASKTLGRRFSRKPVARTQPYSPPLNVPMPDHNSADIRIVSPRSRRDTFESPSPPQRNGERSGKKASPKLLPGQLSPRTFMDELDERLSLLQQEPYHSSMSSPPEEGPIVIGAST